jgi:aryl-alcohol dehydrogenase-like predicted oxidoreductase
MNSRPSLSKICFGCEPLGGTDWGDVDVTSIAAAINRALELGINFFDTADVYGLGLSETRLSDILGVRRHDIVIATKGGVSWQNSLSGERSVTSRDSAPNYVRYAVESSLKRLRLDRIPIYYIHWPDPNTDIRKTFECLAKLQDTGKIGWIGCSNFNSNQVRLACEVANISFLQLPLNILEEDIDPKIYELILEKDIALVAYKVLANGMLGGRYGLDTHFSNNDRRSRLPFFQGDSFRASLKRVQEISSTARSLGLTCAQYSVSKIIERTEISSAILGIKHCWQIEETAAILKSKNSVGFLSE